MLCDGQRLPEREGACPRDRGSGTCRHRQ
jgi:hypothetical protein